MELQQENDEGCFLSLVATLLGLGLTFYRALVMMLSWDWLVAPAYEQIPEISYFSAVGLMVAAHVVIGGAIYTSQEDRAEIYEMSSVGRIRYFMHSYTVLTFAGVIVFVVQFFHNL